VLRLGADLIKLDRSLVSDLAALEALDVPFVQGYLLGRPAPLAPSSRPAAESTASAAAVTH
jgi:EAL domain-containing protein (putative c-di-GMP-specific phosphodiesterase class I)